MKNLPKPTSQIQEVLYELIKRLTIDRKSMMFYCNIHNLTARISNLRDKGIEIETIKFTSINKYGREVEFAKYKLKNKKDAIKCYKILLNQN